MAATHENIHSTCSVLLKMGVSRHKIQIILTKESVERLLDVEVQFMNITPGEPIAQLDMRFGGYRVYLGDYDRVQVISDEIML